MAESSDSAGRGADNLPSEVVGQKYAVVGFDVQWSRVEIAILVVSKVEHFQDQLATGDDHGTADASPAQVGQELIGVRACAILDLVSCEDVGIVGGTMNGGIENGDDAVFCVNRVGNKNIAAVAVQKLAQSLGNHRLAISRRFVNEDRFPAADGRSQLLDQVVADDQFAKRFLKGFRTARRSGDRLSTTLFDIGFQRNQSLPHVAALLERLPRAVATQFR